MLHFARLCLSSCLLSFAIAGAAAQPLPSSLSPVAGDVVVSGFSGIAPPDPLKPLPPGKSRVDQTFIDPNGFSARVTDLRGAGVFRDTRVVAAQQRLAVTAGQVGQIFGIAIGDQLRPTIYLAATSAYGLQIARKPANGIVERLKAGSPGAQWADGQFGMGLQGGPGAIYAIDGETGAVSLFANVTLNGVPNPGPGLGNLAFDPIHRQIFVSDLYTGMIHRLGLDGSDLGSFDHGVAGRGAAQLPPTPFDPRIRLNITGPSFNVDDPSTWGFAPPSRRVWAVALRQDRLFYSVQEGPQIWSVGILPDGGFAQDARLEADVPSSPGPYAVSDIAFATNGAMVIAQRAPPGRGVYDYSAFTEPGEPRVLRFWLKTPLDPPSPGLWKPIPEEFSIGFAGAYRNTSGGVSFGYGFDRRGQLDINSCGASLLVTGEKLRLNTSLKTRLDPGGPLPVDGLQIGYPDVVRTPNEIQPWPNSFWDYDGKFEDGLASGRLGSVRSIEAPCLPQLAAAGGAGTSGPGSGSPPYVDGPHNPPDPECFGSQCNECPPGVPCGPTGSVTDLEIKKTGATSPPSNVNAYSFMLAVNNLGPAFVAPPNTVVVSDAPPVGMTFSSVVATPTGWVCLPTSPGTSPFTCKWAGGLLPSGPIATISVTATAIGPGPYPPFTNCASVSLDPMSGYQDINPANDTDCVTVKKPNGVDVAIKKTGVIKQDPAVTGYTFTLATTNIGNAFTGAGAVTVTDVVPVGMTFVITATTGAPNWNCGAPGTLAAGATLTCNYIGTGPAAPGASMGNIVVNATATGPGPFENCSSVGLTASSGLQDANLDDNKSCATVGTIDLALEKKGVVDTKPDAPTGISSFTYTLVVTNTGAGFTVPGGIVSVTDVAPANMTFTSASGTAGWTCLPATVPPAGTLSCSFAGGAVAAGPGAVVGTITITATYTGTASVENCASVGVLNTSGFQDQSPNNNKGCVTLTPPGGNPNIDVSLAKSFEKGVNPGTGVFTLKVKNEGGDIASGVTIAISDPVPTGVTVTGFAGSSASNWACLPLFPVSGPTTLNCHYTGTASFSTGSFMPDLALNATLANAGAEVGIYQNCAIVALSNSSGPIAETNAANNTGCAVTNTINTAGCVPGSPNCSQPQAVCSQDVLFVVDASVSITNVAAVKNAIKAFLVPMKDKGGKVDIYTFNNKANWTAITTGWTPVTSGSLGTLNSQINGIALGGTRTNWDDALERAYNIVTAHNPKPLVIFITDGEPTAYNNASGTEIDANNMPVTASQEAVTWINQIRAAGSPLIAVGFGPVSTSGHLDAAFTGNSSGPGNVNLETSSVIKMGSVSSLQGVLSALGNQMCGTLSLNKRITNGPFQHMIPLNGTSVTANDTVQFSLTLTNNSSTAISGIAVQDQVPAALTTVTVGTASIGALTVTGNLIDWSGVSLGAHQTATATFNAKFNKTYTAPITENYTNYAQVTAATAYTATNLNNMNPVSGPVTEVDESLAVFSETIYKETPNACAGSSPPAYCFLNVSKNRKNPGAEDNTCTSSANGGSTNPCTFTINVSLTNIPAGSSVAISDQLTLNNTPVTWPGTVAPVFCSGAPPTNVSFACPHTGLTSFSGDVTVQIPPGQSGPLKNCITVTVTNTTTTPPFNVSGTACATIPLAQVAGLVSCQSGQSFIAGKGCVQTPVCASPLAFNAAINACACPAGSLLRNRQCVTDTAACRPPLAKNAAGACVCPQGSVLRGRECVQTQITCNAPFVPKAAATNCVCPAGSVLRNRECVASPPTCQAPFVRNAAGACACPQGSVQRGKECVRPDVCRAPLAANAAGQCACPAGTTRQGARCVPPVVCQAPMRPDARGACVCPVGTLRKGNQCVERVQHVCQPPARLNRRGVCECPPEFIARGKACIPRERQRPSVTPGDVIRILPGILPGGGRSNPVDPRGGGKPDRP